MTREQAIEIIRQECLCVDRDCNIEKNCGNCDLAMPSKEPILEAYKMAIKVLEKESCDDCISRLSIINKLEILMDMYGNDFYWAVRKIIDAEPSIQPKHRMGRWIDADGDNARCGCCNRLNHLYGTYCKHCGAKMQDEVDGC